MKGTDVTWKLKRGDAVVAYSKKPPKQNWNVCFQEARDAKLKELRAAWAEEKTAGSTKAPPSASAQEQTKPKKP